MTFKGPFQPKAFYDSVILTYPRIVFDMIIGTTEFGLPARAGSLEVREREIDKAMSHQQVQACSSQPGE